LHRLGSKLNRTVLNSCGNPLSVPQITRDFLRYTKLRVNGWSHSHQKRSQTRKLTIFGNTKQVIQDYDTVFDNSILSAKMTHYGFSSVPCRDCRVCPRVSCLGTKAGLPGTKAVPWHQARQSITVIRPQKDLQLETLFLRGIPPAAGGKHSPRTSSLDFGLWSSYFAVTLSSTGTGPIFGEYISQNRSHPQGP
jgi:hypothetical protein